MLKPEPKPHSASAITARVQQQSGLNVSLSTMTRTLRKSGLQHLRPKGFPILTAKHRVARLQFAKAALRSSTRHVLITDSSIFTLHGMGRPTGRWCILQHEAPSVNSSTVMVQMSTWVCPAKVLPRRGRDRHSQAHQQIHSKTWQLYTGQRSTMKCCNTISCQRATG